MAILAVSSQFVTASTHQNDDESTRTSRNNNRCVSYCDECNSEGSECFTCFQSYGLSGLNSCKECDDENCNRCDHNQ